MQCRPQQEHGLHPPAVSGPVKDQGVLVLVCLYFVFRFGACLFSTSPLIGPSISSAPGQMRESDNFFVSRHIDLIFCILLSNPPINLIRIKDTTTSTPHPSAFPASLNFFSVRCMYMYILHMLVFHCAPFFKLSSKFSSQS